MSYLIEFALPNFYFYVATSFDLLRANDVPKADYLGWLYIRSWGNAWRRVHSPNYT
jgi:hypothetical protein